MSTEISFANNYRDMCERYGTAAGFQFEFYCSRCHDTWRCPFEPYRGGRLAEWLNRGISTASGLLGSVGSGVGSAAEGLAGSGWGSARDASFQRAIKAAEGHFNRCARCACYVCGRCWHPEQGLCFSCAPDTAGEAMAAQQRGLNDLAMQQAYDEGQRRGQEYDARTARQLVCPQCRTEAHGGRFCPGCGFELAQQRPCAGCRAPMPDGAAFCPGCGHRQ
ncbi:ribosomal protein L32 [Streptomyces olivoverticillatus]|uniref:Ribosomal protein L32 n=1 Tax=Streptomyces olivoverticillatus TaxID=66427 RepID=A0A7W7LL08_9ACTN|nr:ribosomal protein L32 [Streptomyces olivoverticillatus]